MLVGIFHSYLRILNPKIKIFAVADTTKPLGLYLVTDNFIEHICGSDRNEVPEFTYFDKKGHIIKSGWRRIVEILIDRKLVNKSKAEILFSAVFDGRKREMVIEESDIDRAMKQAFTVLKSGNENHIESKHDDIMDIASMIRKERE
jgi:hypothetical protein